jgi:hypothetical protein
MRHYSLLVLATLAAAPVVSQCITVVYNGEPLAVTAPPV